MRDVRRRPNAIAAGSGAAPVLILLASAAGALGAQVEATATLGGIVMRGEAPLESGTVVLHRVTPDTAGEIDSVAVNADGTFSFRLPTVPDPGGRSEVYFASVRHDGILYFGDAVSTAIQLDSAYTILVHDTITAPEGGAALPLAVRYLILEDLSVAAIPPSAAGPTDPTEGWQVTDLFLIRHDGDRTFVSPDGGRVWSYPVPAGARYAEVGASDVGADAARIEGGRVVVSAPLPPGERQIVIRYVLESPEVVIPLAGPVEAVELLVREPAPPLEVIGLLGDAPVEMEGGATYRRFVGSELGPGSIVVREESGGRTLGPGWLAGLVATALAIAGIVVLVRAQGTPRSAPARGRSDPAGVPVSQRDRILLEVARIDETLEGEPRPSHQRRLRKRRSILLDRLKDTGTAEPGPRGSD